MEVLQCDGCDFRAESYDDLKTHIQDVHTAFLQPTDVGEGDGSPCQSRADSLNSPNQTEGEEEEQNKSPQTETDFSSSNQMPYSKSANHPNKTANQLFQCKICVRYFRSKSLLSEHTNKVHGTSLSGGNSPASHTSKQSNYNIVIHDSLGKVFSCQYCTYKSPRKARILKHQKMYHKGNLDPPESLSEAVDDPESLSSEEPSEELSEDVVERGILESMVKPLGKSRGNQALRREWCDNMMKKHRNMVKMISTIQPSGEGEGSAGSSKSDSPSSPRSPPISKMVFKDLSGNEGSSVVNSSVFKLNKPASGISPYQYSQIQSVAPNSTGSSILSERSTFVMSDVSNSAMEMDLSMLDDSRSTSEEDDEELGDEDDPNYTDPLSTGDSAKQLLSEEDNKMLETKGIPFRRYMNRFQCPFCSFLTMHRRSISRHIENIHLSGKTTVYKCDECPFICTSPLKLGTHKQSHSSDWDTMDLTSESPGPQNNETPESVNGGNVAASKVNGKKLSNVGNDLNQQNPHRCTLCSFSTTTLKGLRVHQQHKHSYCDDMQAASLEGSTNEQQDSELETFSSSPSQVQKTQTSILGLGSKKHLTGKTARKSINDLPLDLSPVKKRTRIDEIANNLQSKISQQQEDLVINLEEIDDEEEGELNMNEDAGRDKEENNGESKNHVYVYNKLYEGRVGKRKRTLTSKLRNIPIAMTLSDDEDKESIDLKADLQDQSSQDSRDTSFQENLDYTEDSGMARFYCKHCDYHNKSARSVSTHYQRMHPYIKFSFRYILDPEDQSAVFRCLECFIEYTNFNNLHEHYMDHHPEASNVLNFNQPDLLYMCRFCSYTSPNVRSLMPHYQRMHPEVKINNAMIFSSYVVEQQHKGAESQTLREILNSGPKSFTCSSSTSTPKSSSSPVLKSVAKTQDSSSETEALKEVGNVVVYDCDLCSFASPNMHSVLVHYQKKHPEQKASYFRIQKTMRVITVDRPQSAGNSSYNINIPTPAKSPSATMPFGTDEEIYYCKHCVYSNRSVVGVLVHYQKRHPEIKVTAKYIKHAAPTSGLMKLMDELQIAPPKQFLKQFNNNGFDGSSNSHARVVTEKGEAEMLFFCQHCDYGNRTVKGVLIHYQKKHRDAKSNADLVRRHTAVVRSQRERAQMGQSGTAASAIAPAAPTETEASSGCLRSLKCRHCSYTSPYVYALKKHLKKDHPTVKATAMTILHWAYQDGILEAGYHCEWCIYSHAEPNGLLMHYQRRHPEHNVDYTYMASKLWAGPDTTTSQPGGNAGDSKHYQCRDCAFEACSIWDITNHYQAVHPWAVKGDESVLLDIIKGPRSQEKVHPSMAKGPPFTFLPTAHDEGPLDIPTSPQEHQHHQYHPRLSHTSNSISNNPYQCTVCLSEYNSLHGLLTHYGKKHPGMKVKAADFAQEADINPSSVYKCRHCPYVNSRIHGVLTHYQKRHPLVKVTAEDFADDIEQVKDITEVDDKCKTQRQGYGAYRCKMCPYTHGTLEKLKIHYEKYHNQPASDMFKPSLVPYSTVKEEVVAECSATSVSSEVQEVSEFKLALTQFPINKGDTHAVFRCQLCKYFCSTRKGIARHYRIKHNNVRAQPEGKNNVFKCALCSYTNPIRKGLAAHYQKRHDIDAYYTHCLAASKTLTEKPSKVVVPVASEAEGSELSEELRLAVERRECSLCAFQAFSRKSIVSHYIKRHPGVFPKRQHTSKLGRYFTVLYAKEPEHVEEVTEVVEVEPKPEPEGEVAEWLPFKCLKCFQRFSTVKLLSMHYNDHHSGKDHKQDFVIHPSLTEDGTETELYQCSHCELKFLGLPLLSTHLMNHNEEFQKRAMRQERRKQLLCKQKLSEPPETKPEKLVNNADKAPIGYRCNFCVEVHPTLRAICNHLRKHVQYGEVKEGHVKQEVADVPLSTIPAESSLTNGEVEEVTNNSVMESVPKDLTMVAVAMCPVVAGAAVAMETAEMAVGMSPVVGAAVLPVDQVKERLTGGHPCAQCDRVFMSMQGLRSHERSHSAMAMFTREDKYSCQYCQFVSPFRHNLDKHVQSHHRHHKPFRCKLCPFKSAYLSRLKSHLHKAHPGENTYKCLSCPFSSMTISQLKEHSLRDHGQALTLPKLRAGTTTHTQVLQAGHDPQISPFRLGSDPHQTTLTSDLDDAGYLHETVDVRRQLSHYQVASRSHVTSSSPTARPQAASSDTRPDGILTCEFCEFSSGYMQSLRRHYRDRHGGKKLFKCKDCSFFTCSKSTFTMHVEAGHTVFPEEGPKDLRCPLCLYHTKYKSNMIDHIVLHKEERVVPLEVSRYKLSRHLAGGEFRCHKCTFTCSSDQSLQLHLTKHNEMKPYQCQLCYYDSRQRYQLETHLREEHKVIRNFELMGQVNLDQLDAIKERNSSAEEEEAREEDGLGAMEDEVEMEESIDEELEQKEEKRIEEEEAEAEKPAPKDVPVVSPSSSSVTASAEKRFPCEFCGRCFTNSIEWERHVLRHGMTVTNSRTDTSTTPAIDASASALPSIGSSTIGTMTDRGLDLSSNGMEVGKEYASDLLQSSNNLNEEDDKEMLETKK
ncbi:zinc finger protein 462 isoform X1 [Oncorhynchus mykiss]|uniref:C2H2-type domain-containing protein n=1 Tax=Oncorhynchus mykiss TaxID=8022 RepID=A0A8C7W753_ONCMY|nr:zinc finger protein 462 isoform X1 [Oncorhynchus mykiss]